MPLNTYTHALKRKRTAFDLFVVGVTLAALTLLAIALHSSTARADTIVTSSSGGASFQATPSSTPGLRAKLSSDGRTALIPDGAPPAVKEAIAAANEIVRKPYIYGGGHATYKKLARGYDCSSTVSWALGNAGLMNTGPLDSSSFMRWGKKGKGSWITVYTNPGHAYVYIAGLRFDTSGKGEDGPRWRTEKRSNRGFRARHPKGL